MRRRGLSTLSATQLFLLSFAGLVAVGTLGLLVLPGLYTGPDLSLLNALFTATSAVCVTGLIVVDTATYFTPAGQAWIALLIQLGGLGILTFTTLIIALVGRRASLASMEAAGGKAEIVRHLDPMSLVRGVVGATLVLEAVGASLLWAGWRGRLGAGEAVWPAVFHAISAFCNAGFSVFSGSLVGFRSSPITLLTVSGLIVLGGIGFVVLADVRERYRSESVRRFSTHTRLVLIATTAMLVGGTVLFYAFEAGHRLASLGAVDRLLNAWFMSVTPRTAGFNTVSYDGVSNASLFLTILFMIVGGSPGSAAGGLKTTTVALLFLAFWARLRGREEVSFAGRTIPASTIDRAAGLTIGGIVILATAVFLLTVIELPAAAATERVDFLRLVFEAHSAFGTVGLSMGATPELSGAGRLILTVLMFVGRVGPLAVASGMAVARSGPASRYRYAHEDVAIG